MKMKVNVATFYISLRLQGKLGFPYNVKKNVWSNMYYCVNILLTKNALEHVHLEAEFVQNQLHISGRLTRFPSHTLP